FLFFGFFLINVFGEDAILFEADLGWFTSDIQYKVLKDSDDKYDVYIGEKEIRGGYDTVDSAINSVKDYYKENDIDYTLKNYQAYSSDGFAEVGSGRSKKVITTIDLEKRAYGFMVENSQYDAIYREKFVEKPKSIERSEEVQIEGDNDEQLEDSLAGDDVVEATNEDSGTGLTRSLNVPAGDSSTSQNEPTNTVNKQSSLGQPSVNVKENVVVSEGKKEETPKATLSCDGKECKLIGTLGSYSLEEPFKSKEEAAAYLIVNKQIVYDEKQVDEEVLELVKGVEKSDFSIISDLLKKTKDDEALLASLAQDNSIYSSKLEDYKSGKEMNKDELNFFIRNVKLNPNEVEVYVNSLKDKSDDLSNYESGNGCVDEDDCKEKIKDVKKEIYDINKVLSDGKYDANALLLTLNSADREAFLENVKNNDHGDDWLGSISSFFDFRTQQDIAVGIYMKTVEDERNNLNKGIYTNKKDVKVYDPNKVEDAVLTFNKNLVKNAVAGSGVTCDDGDFGACLTTVRQKIIACGEDENCKGKYKLVAARLEAGSEHEMIEYGWTQSIISSIISPRASDLKAARMFGFEEDYSNVPTFLKESFPSQMCMGKIEGYLDKTETEAGGLTKYGCDNEDYVAKYNEVTKKFEQVGNPNCIKVMVDLRAQRTQITPNGEVAISYSYFLRAPNGVDLKAVLAVTYMDAGVRKKDLLSGELIKITGGETKKGFDAVDFKINSSDISKVADTQESFYLGLLALDSANRPVYSESVPIALITGGDSYTFNVFSPVGSNTGGSVASGGVANKELTASDMLDLI
ncbi:MAG: hypothetical protein KC589_04205, partial [Nanoarchaeota archaeon]|nr:hypothetical protein [Nanoarchaeota archaeon]